MMGQWQHLLTNDSSESTPAEAQVASFPRSAVDDQATDHPNSGSRISPSRNYCSIVEEPTAFGCWDVDAACANPAQQAARSPSQRADIGGAPQPSTEIGPYEKSDGCLQLATDALAWERQGNSAVVACPDDEVIRSLSWALEAAAQGKDHSCAKALRIAISIRLQGLRSESRTKAEPTEAKRRRVLALQNWRLKRVVEYIDSHLSAKITLGDMAAIAGLSPMHFASQFRMATNVRPHEFLLQQRIRRAEALLQNTTMPIVEIALTVGFQAQAHFTTVFKRFVGETPQRWRVLNQTVRGAQDRKRKEVEISSPHELMQGLMFVKP
jgi:AraC family transcriptional regulator